MRLLTWFATLLLAAARLVIADVIGAPLRISRIST